MAQTGSETILAAFGGRSMQDLEYELLRIHLPKLFGKSQARVNLPTISRIIAA